jgi:hypothetical protein
LSFHDAESVVAMNGRRVLSFKSRESTAILVQWDLVKQSAAFYEVHRIPDSDASVGAPIDSAGILG